MDRIEAPPKLEGREPASGRPLTPVAIADAEEVRSAVARARAAQPRWAAQSYEERGRALLRLRDLLDRHADELCETIARETGKPLFEAMYHELLPMLVFTNHFARRARRILGERTLHLHLFWPLKRSFLRHDPRGVIGVVGPWNFPLSIPLGDVVMALAAGNAAVVKPSEWTPRTMLRAKELIDRAGIDPDLVAVLPGGKDTGAALVDAGCDAILFTGSTATGRRIAARCGELLIPCIAELGGKDAVLVMPDADVEFAARLLVTGGFFNAGQACASYERVLVPRALHDPLVARLCELTAGLRTGDPLGPDPMDVGPLTMPSQVDVVDRHVREAAARGARILVGGKRLEGGAGRYYAPTLVDDVTGEMLLWREETFGPVLALRRYDEVPEAVAAANETDYALTTYVIAGNVDRARALARDLSSGSVVINDIPFHHAMPEPPWGGSKHSGLGRTHSDEGLRALCHVKFVSSPRVAVTPPWFLPYDEGKSKLLGMLRKIYRGPLSRWF